MSPVVTGEGGAELTKRTGLKAIGSVSESRSVCLPNVKPIFAERTGHD